MNGAHHAMEKHIPHTGNRKLNVIPGWDSEMDSRTTNVIILT